MEQPRPVVTITDPSRPGQPEDVLAAGDERIPWRPSARLLTAVVVVLALVAGAAVLVQRHRDHERDLASVRAMDVRLTGLSYFFVSIGDPKPPQGAQLSLENRGPSGITVDGGRLGDLGTLDLTVPTPLAPGSRRDFPVTFTAGCPRDVRSMAFPSSLALTVTTSRGVTVHRDLRATGGFQTLQDQWRVSCGQLTVAEALAQSTVEVVSEDRRAVHLLLHVRNPRQEPLVISTVLGHEGTRARGRWPVTVPPQDTVSVAVTLSISGCRAARSLPPSSPPILFPALTVVADGTRAALVPDGASSRAVAALRDRTC